LTAVDDLGDLGIGQVAQVPQHDSEPLSNGKRSERTAQLGEAGIEQRIRRRLDVGCTGEAPMQRAALVDHGDPKVCRWVFQTGEARPDANEDIVNDVLCCWTRSGEHECNSQQVAIRGVVRRIDTRPAHAALRYWRRTAHHDVHTLIHAWHTRSVAAVRVFAEKFRRVSWVPHGTQRRPLLSRSVWLVGSPEIRICGRSSKVRITASVDATAVTVDGEAVLATSPGLYEVVRSSRNIEIVCPEGCEISVSTGSGSITTRGRLGAVRIMTVSGASSLEHVAAVEARSASGRVEVGDCDGNCRVVTGSGRVELARSNDVEIATVSGAVRIDQLHAGGTIRTVTGAIRLSADGDAQLSVHSVSGKVAVELPSDAIGSLVLRSVTGATTGVLPVGDGAHIEVSTISGTISVRTA
jgi:DUF4097 and DUF4098 domain-containing protein YvlB